MLLRGLIRALTFLMFLMFAVTTDSVGVIIPQAIREFRLSMAAAGSFHYAGMIGIALGGLGLGAVAAAAFKGARVIGVYLDDAKLATARKAGATQTINSANEDLHEMLEQMTDGRGPDVVIEAIGSRQTFRAAVDEVARSVQAMHGPFRIPTLLKRVDQVCRES